MPALSDIAVLDAARSESVSYLILFPCIAIICLIVGRLDLTRSVFVVFALLLTALMAAFQWFVPGIDVIIATCLTMALANFLAWFIDVYATPDAEQDSVHEPKGVSPFCSQQTHDYAVSPRDAVFAIGLINNGNWEALAASFKTMTAAERQGFYANLNYSSASENALQQVINSNTQDVDAHILMGHMKLCHAKRLGLQPGANFDEPVALAISQAFTHFNLALRIQPDDTEALCGLLIAKGFTGLSAEHMLSSLKQLLLQDPEHLHGVIAAAKFLVLSTAQANEFISVIENAVDGRAEATVAIARIITHIECMALAGGNASVASRNAGLRNSQVIADLYQQLRCYQRENGTLGDWQQGISDNIIAYMLQLIGDQEESNVYLKKIDGSISPYPWQSDAVS